MDQPHPNRRFHPGSLPGVSEGKPMNHYIEEDPLAPARGIVTAMLLTFDAFIVIWCLVKLI